MDDWMHSYMSLMHGVGKDKGWKMMADGDIYCLALKCLEKTHYGWETWRKQHLLCQDKEGECSGGVAAADGPLGDVVADMTDGLLLQHLE